MKSILRITLVLFTIASLAMFTSGCKPKPESLADSTEKQFDKVQEATKEAAKEMKDYTYAQKAEFVAEMKVQLSKLSTSIDELSVRIDKASAAVKAESKPKLQALRDQYAKLNRQLADIGDANESTWNDLKTGMQNGFNDLSNGFDKMRQWVSEKIAP